VQLSNHSEVDSVAQKCVRVRVVDTNSIRSMSALDLGGSGDACESGDVRRDGNTRQVGDVRAAVVKVLVGFSADRV
jgi:hypothetical protein